jgi:predicted dehydrogenase/nucleoside-diphosphate-sugar epimerase
MTTHSAQVRTAFVGAGAMAQAHLAALRRLQRPPRVLGVFDPDREAAAAFAAAAGCVAFATLDQMLTTLRPDVVHVCTTAGTHYEVAKAALVAGAHVYVEKPFVESVGEAKELLTIARTKQRLVCCGHQVLTDPAYERLMSRAGALGPVLHAESRFFFNSPDVRADASPARLAAQLLDILPHPLYTLVATLERIAPGATVDIDWMHVTPTTIEALFTAGAVTGRLNVHLRARPVTSTLMLTGERGSLAADFMRGTVIGTDNPGTSPIEKILNPFFEGLHSAFASLAGVVKRYAGGGSYPGLVELLDRFYPAVAGGGVSPLSPHHLELVVRLYEDIAMNVREAARAAGVVAEEPAHESDAPLVVLTGAGGFLGRATAAALVARGYRVRGIGRSLRPVDSNIAEWIQADISRAVPEHAFTDAVAIVHAAAATSGGFAAHKRHSVEGSRLVIEAAARDGVRQFIHVSSLSVVRPPKSGFEMQDESTGEATNPRVLGPYTWGKCLSEQLVLRHGQATGIKVKTLRPAALIDWRTPELPGLVGRRLFGAWHLGLGRPSLPIPVCSVQQAASVIAWSVAQFDAAPSVLNLMDPTIATRRDLLRRMRRHGWTGRMVWVPISLLSAAMVVATRAIGFLRGSSGEPMAVWQILRPRRFRAALSSRVLAAARETAPVPVANSSAA